jgi:hypothetical protein
MDNNFRGEYSFKVGTKTYHTLLNLNTLRIMCAKQGLKLSDLDNFLSANPFDSVPSMVYYGMINYNLKYGSKQSFGDFESFCAKALDEDGLFEEMSGFVTESLGGNEEQKKTGRTRRVAEKK